MELFTTVNRIRQSGWRANSNGVDKELKGGRIQLRRHSYCPENYQLPQWIQNNSASMSCLRPRKKKTHNDSMKLWCVFLASDSSALNSYDARIPYHVIEHLIIFFLVVLAVFFRMVSLLLLPDCEPTKAWEHMWLRRSEWDLWDPFMSAAAEDEDWQFVARPSSNRHFVFGKFLITPFVFISLWLMEKKRGVNVFSRDAVTIYVAFSHLR